VGKAQVESGQYITPAAAGASQAPPCFVSTTRFFEPDSQILPHHLRRAGGSCRRESVTGQRQASETEICGCQYSRLENEGLDPKKSLTTSMRRVVYRIEAFVWIRGGCGYKFRPIFAQFAILKQIAHAFLQVVRTLPL